MPEQVRITLRLDDEEYQRFRVLLAQRREQWQTLLLRLLREWADGPAPEPKSPAPEVMDDRTRAIVELLKDREFARKLQLALLTFANHYDKS